MYRGKRTCKILKEIRQEIARANDISLVTSECRYQGDCAGTCPKCEAEVAYLEQQLNLRRMAGKAVVLSGLAAGALVLGGCKGGSDKPAPTTATSSSASATRTAGAVDMDPESCNEGSSFFRNFLGLDGDERGQLQGEVGPGFDPDPVGNGEGEGELEGDVYIEPQPLEGDVPYTPEDTSKQVEQ